MTPSNVLRGTVGLVAVWLAGVPAVSGGDMVALAMLAPGLLGLTGSMAVREPFPRRMLTAGALLMLGAAAAMTVQLRVLC